MSTLNSYIIFSIGGYWFALPSHQIIKIIKTPSAEEGGLLNLGLVQVAKYSIQILDLPHLLMLKPRKSIASTSSQQTSANRSSAHSYSPFLVVLKGEQTQSLFGITLATPPDIAEIPAHERQVVPTEKRQTGAFRYIREVVPYNNQQSRQILLVLDLLALLEVPQVAAQTEAIDASRLLTTNSQRTAA